MTNNVLTNVRIIKRYNVPGILIGIFALLSIALPVILVTLPWISMSIYVNDNYSQTVAVSAVALIRNIFNMSNGTTYFTDMMKSCASVRESQLCYYLMEENVIAACVWYLLSCLFAVILFIQGIVILVRGKVNHPHALVINLFIAFVCNAFLLADAIRLGFYFNFVLKKTYEVLQQENPYFIKFQVWPAILSTSISFGLYFISAFLHLFGLRKRYYQEDIEFIDIEPKPFEKNNGIERNTLPNSITTVGGHAYAKNTNLEIANIPYGVKELGIGAFSNCLRLKVVSIPTSVKMIGANCFFNCGKLRRLNYGGSKQQWRKVVRGSNWLERAGTTTVLCKDGAISVNPKH